MNLKRAFPCIILLLLICTIFACHFKRKTGGYYKVAGKRYYPLKDGHGFVQDGMASWYGKDFHGRKTSNGETYNMYAMTSAHKTLPFNTYVKVINLENSKTTIVRINDRGPFIKGRIIDLTYTAARDIDMVDKGTARVRIKALGFVRDYRKGKEKYVQPDSYTEGRFSIQIGAFQERDNADRLRQRLLRSKENARILGFNSESATLYRVRVGIYDNFNDALNALSEFESMGYPDAFVVRE
ncbi:MAG: septal ring lytic transglycosylase RlpA family protein [Nitrospinota bacterium]